MSMVFEQSEDPITELRKRIQEQQIAQGKEKSRQEAKMLGDAAAALAVVLEKVRETGLGNNEFGRLLVEALLSDQERQDIPSSVGQKPIVESRLEAAHDFVAFSAESMYRIADKSY